LNDEPDELKSYEMGMCGYLRERECAAMANRVHEHSKNDRVGTVVVSMGIDVGTLSYRQSESLSIGFQVNRAIRIEHIMKRGLFGGFGLGVEEVRGLG
jgi:hypothetical protein